MRKRLRVWTAALLAATLCGCDVLQEAREALRPVTPTPLVTASQGQVRDAITQLPIAGARLQAGPVSGLTDIEGAFSITSLRRDPILVSAPGYEAVQVWPTAEQPVVVDLVPEPSTTFEAIYTYEQRQEFVRQYDLLHPDVQALFTREDFRRYMEEHRPFDIVDLKVGTADVLTSGSVLGKVYDNLAQVPVQATVRTDGQVLLRSWLEYAAKVDGIWRWLRGPLLWPTPTPTQVAMQRWTQTPSAPPTEILPTWTSRPLPTLTAFPPLPAIPTPYQPILPGREAVVIGEAAPVHTGPGEWYAVALVLPRNARVLVLDWPRWIEGMPWYPVQVQGWNLESWCNGATLQPFLPTPMATVTQTATHLPTTTPTLALRTPTPTGVSPALARIAFTSERDGNQEVYVMNADGSDPRNVTQSLAQEGSPSWAPTRDRLAFVSDRNGNSDVFVIGVDGSGLQQVTSQTADEIHPAWSPDGALIAYVSNIDGDWEIFVASAAGTGAVQITHNEYWDSWPAWSPDGRRLAFTSARDGNYELYSYDLTSGSETRLTHHPASDAFPAWSPSGSEIAFVSARDGQLEVYVLDLQTMPHAVLRLTSTAEPNVANRYPTWSPDGKWVAFTSLRNGNADIYLMNRQGWGLSNLTIHPAVDELPAWAD